MSNVFGYKLLKESIEMKIIDKYYRYGVLTILLTVGMGANASNWVYFKDYPHTSFDTESIEYFKDEVYIWMKIVKFNSVSLNAFDCKTRVARVFDGLRVVQSYPIQPDTLEEKMMKNYCKSAWEFWK